jgi:hypothetical protein
MAHYIELFKEGGGYTEFIENLHKQFRDQKLYKEDFTLWLEKISGASIAIICDRELHCGLKFNSEKEKLAFILRYS